MEDEKTNNLNNLEESLKALIKAWHINYLPDEYKQNFNYEAAEDVKALATSENIADLKNYNEKKGKKIKLKLSYFYNTHVLPNPFWGNILNPEILVLALNPSYAPFADEIESAECYDILKKIFKNKNQTNVNIGAINNTINWLQKIENTSSTIKGSCSYWWRNEVFRINANDENKNTELKDKDIDIDNFITKIGVFNMCGYHSASKTHIPKSCLLNGGKYLPTQIALREHLINIIKSGILKKIIIIWGKQDWIDFFKDSAEIVKLLNTKENDETPPDSKVITINYENTRNKSINTRLKKDDAYNWIKNIIEDDSYERIKFSS